MVPWCYRHRRAIRPHRIRHCAIPRIRQRAQHIRWARLHSRDRPVVDRKRVLDRARGNRVEAGPNVHGDVRVGNVTEGIKGVLEHRGLRRGLRGGGDGHQRYAGEGATVARDDDVAGVSGGGVRGGVLGFHAKCGVGFDEAVKGGWDGGLVDGQVHLRGAVVAVVIRGCDRDEDDVGAIRSSGPVDREENPLVSVVGRCGESTGRGSGG